MEEINQNPVIQPDQLSQPNTPTPLQKNNNFYKYLFFIAIVVLLAVIVGFYFLLNNKINKLNITETSTNPTPTINPSSTTTPTSQESTLTEYDSTHNLYTNNKFGFSLIIPKTVKQASCLKESDSYRLVETKLSEETPLSFFESQDTIYLAVEYFNNLTGEEKISQGQGYVSRYSGCGKNITTFEQIENRKATYITPENLKIYITNVNGDDDIETFIKSKYGSGCVLGEKTSSSHNNIYDIKILGDGKELGESKCPINFIIETKLSPNKDKLIIFELGQACPLYKDFVNFSCYDEEILNSLKFF